MALISAEGTFESEHVLRRLASRTCADLQLTSFLGNLFLLREELRAAANHHALEVLSQAEKNAQTLGVIDHSQRVFVERVEEQYGLPFVLDRSYAGVGIGNPERDERQLVGLAPAPRPASVKNGYCPVDSAVRGRQLLTAR